MLKINKMKNYKLSPNSLNLMKNSYLKYIFFLVLCLKMEVGWFYND